MALDKNLQTLEKVLNVFDKESLTEEKFLKMFDSVLEVVKDIKERTDKTTENFDKLYKNLEDKNATDGERSLVEVKRMAINILDEEIENIKNIYEKKLIDLNARLAMIKDGQDGKDADENRIIETIKSQIKIPTIEEIKDDMPMMGEEVRDALELLEGEERLDISAIKNLREELDRIASLKATSMLGGLRPANSGIETPSGTINGVNTIFSVLYKPEYITVNGQSIYENSGYSLGSSSGVLQITLENAPVLTDIIRSHYKEL